MEGGYWGWLAGNKAVINDVNADRWFEGPGKIYGSNRPLNCWVELDSGEVEEK